MANLYKQRGYGREKWQNHGMVRNSLVRRERKAQMERMQEKDNDRKKEGEKYKEETL